MTDIQYSVSTTCRHCGNVGPMRVAGRVHDLQEDVDSETGWPGQEHGPIYEIQVCSKCERPTVTAGFYYEGMEEEDWSAATLYPPESKRLTSLPATVQPEYEAAMAVAQISPNAYAVMLGRVLDAVCADRGASGGTLHERLVDLAARGEIPSVLAELAQHVRQFRNVGAHADLGSLTKAEIPFLESLSNAVLEYLYEAPRMVEQAQARLAALKSKP